MDGGWGDAIRDKMRMIEKSTKCIHEGRYDKKIC